MEESDGGGDWYVVNHSIYLYTRKTERRLAGHVNHGAMIRPYKNGGKCTEYVGEREREGGRPHSGPTDCSTCISLIDNDNNWAPMTPAIRAVGSPSTADITVWTAIPAISQQLFILPLLLL